MTKNDRRSYWNRGIRNVHVLDNGEIMQTPQATHRGGEQTMENLIRHLRRTANYKKINCTMHMLQFSSLSVGQFRQLWSVIKFMIFVCDLKEHTHTLTNIHNKTASGLCKYKDHRSSRCVFPLDVTSLNIKNRTAAKGFIFHSDTTWNILYVAPTPWVCEVFLQFNTCCYSLASAISSGHGSMESRRPIGQRHFYSWRHGAHLWRRLRSARCLRT